MDSITEDEVQSIGRHLLKLHDSGIPPTDIMKNALDDVINLCAQKPALRNCNILILNLDHRNQTEINLVNIRAERGFTLEIFPVTLRFGIWVFDSGTVDHTRCEGGWNNWSMYGKFERSGHQNGFVKFLQRVG